MSGDESGDGKGVEPKMGTRGGLSVRSSYGRSEGVREWEMGSNVDQEEQSKESSRSTNLTQQSWRAVRVSGDILLREEVRHQERFRRGGGRLFYGADFEQGQFLREQTLQMYTSSSRDHAHC